MEPDIGTILWALSQPDLRIEWDLNKETMGDGALMEAPDRAYFEWKRGVEPEGEVVWGTDFLPHELRECIEELELRGVEIPPEFVQARDSLGKSRRPGQ